MEVSDDKQTINGEKIWHRNLSGLFRRWREPPGRVRCGLGSAGRGAVQALRPLQRTEEPAVRPSWINPHLFPSSTSSIPSGAGLPSSTPCRHRVNHQRVSKPMCRPNPWRPQPPPRTDRLVGSEATTAGSKKKKTTGGCFPPPSTIDVKASEGDTALRFAASRLTRKDPLPREKLMSQEAARPETRSEVLILNG